MPFSAKGHKQKTNGKKSCVTSVYASNYRVVLSEKAGQREPTRACFQVHFIKLFALLDKEFKIMLYIIKVPCLWFDHYKKQSYQFWNK
uniref:Uncharacterized protein n=1 Tax=Caenorhabditis japonica TaxID=281687 RepID=A0A8R1EBR8_CAEJA